MQVQNGRIEYDGKSFCALPLEVAMRHADKIQSSFLMVFPSGKRISIHHDTSNMKSVLQGYLDKGLKDIYLQEQDYLDFLASIRLCLADKLFDKKQSEEETVMTLSEAYSLLSDSLHRYGMTESSLALAQEISKGGIALIKQSPNIYEMFRKFKNRCQQGFMDTLLRCFIGSLIIRKVPWQTVPIGNKLSLGILLSDIVLSGKDHQMLMQYYHEPDKLTEKVHQHPITTAELLSKMNNILAQETLDVISQHHERPDGSGFPKKLTNEKITPLAAVAIVVEEACQHIIANDFNAASKLSMLSELEARFNPWPKFSEPIQILKNLLET